MLQSFLRLKTTLEPLTASHLHCTAGSARSFTAIRKDAGLCCGSRLRKGAVLAYVGSIQILKDLRKGVSLGHVGRNLNLKDLKDFRWGRCGGGEGGRGGGPCEKRRKGEVFAYFGRYQNLKDQ